MSSIQIISDNGVKDVKPFDTIEVPTAEDEKPLTPQ